MVSKTSIRLPPPRSPNPAPKIGDSEAAERFIRGDAPAAPAPSILPKAPPKDLRSEWAELDDEPRSRGKVKGALFNMRLTAREEAIIGYITKRTPYSKHGLIVAALRPALVKAVKDLTGEDVADLLRDPDAE